MFGVRLRTWNTLPVPNLVGIAPGDLSLMDKFLPKIWNFQLLKPTFLYHNVKILLKRTDFLIGIHQRLKISSKSVRDLPILHCPAEVMHIDFEFVCLSRFVITKFLIMEMLWSSVIFKTIMVSLHRGRIVVVHLYSFFLSTPEFFLRGKFIPKIIIFLRFWGL